MFPCWWTAAACRVGITTKAHYFRRLKRNSTLFQIQNFWSATVRRLVARRNWAGLPSRRVGAQP